ncbi:hypothetical protein ONZ43_g6538 [Nemania bipapillata]|uniref:Uncharacterized protein n=1 Tax=Nemania bipapillata TaxID=110536 RepID=A0ACC2HZ79_9PEZI|nr:hypothetical protein ONZ43_g6538 [Nemania bipapillata]
MDPLSISASIIAVLQATNSVISICYDYRAAAKNSSWELPRVIELVKSLRHVLETLEGLASGAKGTDPDAVPRLQTLQQLCRPNTGNEGGLLALCMKELNILQKKLAPLGWAGPVGSKRVALVQALKWPLKESDTKKSLESIGRFRDTLSLALTTDQTTLILKIDEAVHAIQDNTIGIQGELAELSESLNSARIDEHREKIHQWLAAPDPSSNHVDALGKRRATTGSWFVGSSKFDDWKTSPNSFLWLSGIPGCGKTVLTSVTIEAVLEHCHLSVGMMPNPPPICAVVFFYFDFSQGQKRNHENMIRSLIKQLSQQLQYTSESLESLFSTCTNGNRQPTTEALQNCLKQMIEEFDQVFIILDALDECEDREDLIDSINEIIGWSLQTLHFLATSRMEGEIADGLNVTEEQKLHIQSDLIEEDIRAYIHARLQMDKKLRRWQKDKKDQEIIVGTLMEKSDGMFRWAACQLDALKKCLSRRELQNALASLPKTLDETYDQILCSIDEERCEIVLKILQWLAYSARPLQIEEVADVIAVNTKSKPRLVSSSNNMTGASYNEKGADVNAVGGVYGNALQAAAARGFDDTVKLLLDKGADVNAQGGVFGSALQAASVGGHAKVVKLLLDRQANVGDRGGVYGDALEAASAGGHGEVVLQLINAGADVSAVGGVYGSALHAASYGGHDLIVEHLLNAGADIELPDQRGRTPLYQASSEGHTATIRLLLKRGANVNAEDWDGWAALDEAGPAGHVETVQALLDAGANVNAPDRGGKTALHFIASQGHTDLVRLLLLHGADVNYEDVDGDSPLHDAASTGRHETVRALIEGGANVNTADLRGWSALHAAVVIGHEPTACVLLENGAQISADKDGWTPLHVAVLKGNESIVRLLLKWGADIAAKDSEGRTALDWAALTGRELETLETSAESKVKFFFTVTGLRAAASEGDDVRIRQLLKNGADVDAKDDGGW